MKLETKLKIKDNLQKQSYKFEIIVCNYKTNKNKFNGKILGLTLAEWVLFACENIPNRVIDFDKTDNILSKLKNLINVDYDYTIILSSKTPLITNQVIKSIIEYVQFKGINLCKLPSGYVVNNKYMDSCENIQIDSIYSQNMEEFYIVESASEFKVALQVLSDRINTYHIENGVEIVNPANTYIEPYVDIEPLVKIFPNNSLKGKTKILESSILKENNVIEDSKIGENCCISNSQITGSIICDNVYIAAFSTIDNSLIGANSTIGKSSLISNYDIKENSNLAANTILGETNDSDSGIR